MRILVVHEVEFPNKVVYEWQEFPEVLDALGHDVAVLDYDPRSTWADLRAFGVGPKRQTVSWRLDATRSFELMRMIGPPIHGARRLFAAAASRTVVRRAIAAHRPDAILLYAVPTCGPAVVTEARRAGVPVVFRSIDVLAQLVPRIIAGPVHLLERTVYSLVDHVLVANPRLDTYVKRLSGGRARTSLMLSPVDTDRFSPRPDAGARVRVELGIPVDAPVVVFVGSLFGFVGVDRIIAAWGRIAGERPDARLLVVGGGPDEARLRSLASSTPHAEAIVFTGMAPYDRVPELIAAGDIGICPFEIRAVTRDVNPIKVMQYLACGLPCVCTPLDGTRDVLPSEASGVLYATPGEQFADAVARLISDPARARALGSTGRAWVHAHHSHAAITAQLVEELQSAIDHTGGRTAR